MNNKAIDRGHPVSGPVPPGYGLNSADLGGCYPPRPLASGDNTLIDLRDSSYPTQPHSIIAKYLQLIYRLCHFDYNSPVSNSP